jgi:hypothetical protein
LESKHRENLCHGEKGEAKQKLQAQLSEKKWRNACGLFGNNSPKEGAMWRIDQLLRKDLETNNETTAVAMQQRGKHASTTIELLLEMVFSARSMQRGL